MVILELLLISIAIIFLFISALNPYKVWEITEGWKAKSRPSEAYFLISRIVSFMFLVIAIYIFFGIVTHL